MDVCALWVLLAGVGGCERELRLAREGGFEGAGGDVELELCVCCVDKGEAWCIYGAVEHVSFPLCLLENVRKRRERKNAAARSEVCRSGEHASSFSLGF